MSETGARVARWFDKVLMKRAQRLLKAGAAALFSAILFSTVGFAAGGHIGHDSKKTAAKSAFEGRLQSIAAQFGGRVTLAGENLKTGQRFGIAADRPVPTASVIKLPVMVEAFYLMGEGKLNWSQPVTETAFDRVPGSGILQDLNPKIGLTLGDAITLMIVLSDNTAANIVIHQTGFEPVNARMKELGLKHTKLFGYVFHEKQVKTPEAEKFGLGETTANDMIRLLGLIREHKILTPAACDRMLGILAKQRDNDAFPRYTSSMAGVAWEHKTGALDAVRNDVGIAETPAGPIALAGFAYDSPDKQWTADNAALLVLARLARATLENFLPQTPSTKPLRSK